MTNKITALSHWKIIIVIVGITLFTMFLNISRVRADDYQCTGTLGSVTVDNLNVPQNATCTLNGTRVEGNIFVRSGSTLFASSVHVDGNIQAEHAARVEVQPGSFVGGDIQMKYGGPLSVSWVHIDGNLQAEDNFGSQAFSDNTIGGDLQAFDNYGGVTIWNNIIDGNLQCKENDPPPTGGNNLVGGNMEDQCADLQPGDPPPGSDSDSDNEVCTGMLGTITVENLDVPINATCTLYGTRIEGNLFVRSGATVYTNGVRIDGNIQADRAARVQVRDNSSIGGDIQVIRSGLLIVTSADIGGNLQAFDNTNDQLYFGNTIGGDLQAFDNYGTVSIWDNLIDGNLQCKENVPPPTGGNNLVQGNMEDQCENLLPDEFATGRVLPSEWQFHLFLPAFVK